MKWFLIYLFFSFSAQAGRDDQAIRIERDLSIMISQLQLLIDKNPEALLLHMKTRDRNHFEAEVVKLRIEIEKISRPFADKGKHP